MVFELRAESGSACGSRASVGHKLCINPDTLRNRVEKVEVDSRKRPGTTRDDRKRIAELEREGRELRRANETLRAASAYFTRKLDAHFRASRVYRYAQGPIRSGAGLRAVLDIAPSTHYAAKKREENPSACGERDEEMKREMQRTMSRIDSNMGAVSAVRDIASVAAHRLQRAPEATDRITAG
jgi:transposase